MANTKGTKRKYIVCSKKGKVHIVNATSEEALYSFLETQYPEDSWESLRVVIED